MRFHSFGEFGAHLFESGERFVGFDGARRFDTSLRRRNDFRFHDAEEFVGGSAAEFGLLRALVVTGCAHVLEDKGAFRMDGHQALARRAVVFIHAENGAPEEFEIVFGEAGLLGQEGADEAAAHEQAIRNQGFAAHGAELVLGLFIFPLLVLFAGKVAFASRVGHARNGGVERENGINGLGERDLNGAANLSGVRARAHDGAERAHVEKGPAHEIARQADILLFRPATFFILAFLALFPFLFFDMHLADGFFMSERDVLVQVAGVFDEDRVGGGVSTSDLDVIADAALDGDIRNEAAHGLRINARRVSRIGIAIGIPVHAVEQEDELIAVRDGNGTH